MPVGITAVVVAGASAVAAVAGALTLVILAVSRVLGLHSRAERAVTQGRAGMVFPGPAQPDRPAPAATTIDLTEPRTVDLVRQGGDRTGH